MKFKHIDRVVEHEGQLTLLYYGVAITVGPLQKYLLPVYDTDAVHVEDSRWAAVFVTYGTPLSLPHFIVDAALARIVRAWLPNLKNEGG